VGSPVARRFDAESEAKLNLKVQMLGDVRQEEVKMWCPDGEKKRSN